MSLAENLIAAAKSGNTKEVRRLLGRGALFVKDQFGNTALHEAAWNGNNDVVKMLLNAFCFVDSINNTGFTPLLLASQNGHAKVVKTLLKWKADPLLVNQHGETALHLVAKYNHDAVVPVFAAFRMNMDVRGKDDNTALHIAAKLGNVEMIKALLQAGADPNLNNDKGLQPLECAELGGHKEAAKLLQSTQKPKPRQRSATVLENSCKEVRSKTPPEKQHQHERVMPQRTKSVSAKFPFRPSRDVWAAVNKRKKNSYPLDQAGDQTPGSLEAMSPASMSPCREELDGSRMHSRSASPNGAMASIDQLLSEIEQEYNGPGYKYVPRGQSASPQGERETSIVRVRSPIDDRTPAKAFLKSTRDGQLSRDNYDILEPPGPNDNYSYLAPPSKLAQLHRKCHVYETLLPKEEGEDGDTYVYMAPLKDLLNESLPEESIDSLQGETFVSQTPEVPPEKEKPFAKCTKRAVICTSPIQASTKHEPNSVTEPRKGILSQPSSDSDGKSQLEQYLQDELDTMRQAFQIRLNQLEKRYQRQLVLEQQRSTANGVIQLKNKVNPVSSSQQSTRRRSWHSGMPSQDRDDFVSPEQWTVSPLAFESDASIDETDPVQRRSRPNQFVGLTNGQRGELNEGLKGGARSWREDSDEHSPRLSPVKEDEVAESLTEDAKILIQEKTRQYREKMLKYFKEKSEAQIASIEKHYQAQMGEVERKCEERATERLVHLESRIKDLETMLVQTLV